MTTIGAKFKEKDARKFAEFCNACGVSKSSMLRKLVLEVLAERSYLDDDRKKALGKLQKKEDLDLRWGSEE